MVFQGPTRPGTDVKTFRETGKSKATGGGNSGGGFQGPVREGRDEEIFRTTGKSVLSGSIQAQTIKEEIQKQKIQDDVKRKQEEKVAKGLAIEAEAIKQDKIFSQTIAGQIESKSSITPSGATLELPRSPTEEALGIGTRVKSSGGRFDKERLKRVGREFLFIDGTPISAAKTLAEPLQRFFPAQKGDQLVTGGVVFGSVSDSSLPRGAGGGGTTTEFQILREQVIVDPSLLIPSEVKAQKLGEGISGELVKEIQPQVSSGEITLEEGEKQLETRFQEEFKEKSKDIGFGTEKLSGRIKAAEQPSFDISKAAELGAIAGASLTPTGSAIIATSFVARGTPKVLGGDTLIERGLGVTEIGLGLAGGGIAVKQAERLFDVGLIKELKSQKGKITGKEVFKQPEGSVFDITSTRALGGEAKIQTQLLTPVFKTGKDTFSITGGRGVSKLDFFSLEKGARITKTERFSFGGRQTVSDIQSTFVSKGFKVNLPEEVKGAFGKGFIRKEGKEGFKEFQFGGVSKDVTSDFGKFTGIKAGKLKGFKATRITDIGRGGKSFEKIKGIFAIEEKGLIKRLQLTEGDGIKFIQPSGKGKRTPLSATFQEQIQPPIGLGGQIEKQLIKPPKIILTKTPPGAGITSGVKLKDQDVIGSTGQIVAPTTKLKFEQGVATSLIPKIGTVTFQENVSKIMPRQLQTPIEATLQKQPSRQLTRQIQGLGEFTSTVPITPRTSLVPFGAFDFGIPIGAIPPLLGGSGTRAKPKKRARSNVPIRPSLTGIILEIEAPATTTKIGGLDIGITPGTIRGLETGFNVPKKKKKKSKKK